MKKQDLETQGSKGLAGIGMAPNGVDSRGSHGAARPVSARLGERRKGSATAVKDGQVGERMGSPGSVSVPKGMASQAKGKGATEPPADFTTRETHVDPSKAERLRPVMTRLAQSGNGTARALIDEARDPDSEIHDCFEWDAEKGAEKWRLWQARNYWGAIRVDVQTNEGTVKAPAFIPIVVNDEQSYRPIEEVSGRADWRDQMMGQAKRELESWQKRYDALATVAALRPVFSAIQKVTKARAGKKAA